VAAGQGRRTVRAPPAPIRWPDQDVQPDKAPPGCCFPSIIKYGKQDLVGGPDMPGPLSSATMGSGLSMGFKTFSLRVPAAPDNLGSRGDSCVGEEDVGWPNNRYSGKLDLAQAVRRHRWALICLRESRRPPESKPGSSGSAAEFYNPRAVFRPDGMNDEETGRP